MLEALYLSLFFAWIPLFVIALALKSRQQNSKVISRFAAFSVATCVYALYMQFGWSKSVANPIRIDLLFLVPALGLIYVPLSIWGVFQARKLRSIILALASCALLATSLPPLVQFLYGMNQSRQSMAKMDTIPRLLLEARFRTPETFAASFGAINAQKPAATGYYESKPGSWATRLIINSDGHIWLYFKCRDSSECVHSQSQLDPTTETWPASLEFRAETSTTFWGQLSKVSETSLTLALKTTINGQSRDYMDPVTFNKRDPPLTTADEFQAPVKYLGSYSQTNAKGVNRQVVQIWLWNTDTQYMALYVRQNFTCGIENSFVTPTLLTGSLHDGQLVLKSETSRDSLRLTKIDVSAIEGEVQFSEKPLQSINLAAGELLKSDRFAIAPRQDLEATKEWLKTVTMGYMLHWLGTCSTAEVQRPNLTCQYSPPSSL